MLKKLGIFFTPMLLCLLLASCSFLQPGPSIPIPQGTPPPPGEPVPHVNVDLPGRTSNQLEAWARPISEKTRIPITALEAYGHAILVVQRDHPQCGIAWTTLAGIAYIESRHGTYQGASLSPDGNSYPPIRGVLLDGSEGVQNIPDTDKGELDGTASHDRAMGPFQFIPESWRRFGRDGDGNGVIDPDNIDDSAIAAGLLLCHKGRVLSTPEGWTNAVWSYNNSNTYVRDVRDAAAAYAVGRMP